MSRRIPSLSRSRIHLNAESNATDGGLQPCVSPATYGNLSDGAYTFSVSGSSRVGLSAATEETEFFVDTQPPSFSDIRYPVGLRAGDVTVEFTASDGADGSGIAETECR